MDTSKNKDFFLKQDQNKTSSLEKKTYDLIHSEELELLYKKNAHLLERLSKTGRENTQLYTQLYSINKEKFKLGNKNTILKSKYLGLKEQISLFARQHRKFNEQAFKLKKELKNIHDLEEKTDISPLQRHLQDKEIKIFQKKEQVYKKQIDTLQQLYKQTQSEKENELKFLQQEREKDISNLEEKIQKLLQTLQINQKQSSSINQLKEREASFKKKSYELEDKLKLITTNYETTVKDNKNLALELKQYKQKIKDQAQELKLSSQNLSEREKENKQLKNKEQQILQKAKKLKTEQELLFKESKKIQLRKKDIQEFKKTKEDLLHYKKQNFELIKQADQLKSGFANQLNLFTKERDSLKFQCESLQKALSAGKTGFDQAMISFQHKYRKLYQDKKEISQHFTEAEKQIQKLEENLTESKQQFLKDKEESEQQIQREKDKHISELCGEIKAAKEHNAYLEKRIHNLKAKAQDLFLKEKNQLLNEIQTIKWSQDKNLLNLKEAHSKEILNLESDYENRIKNIEKSFHKKLQHIRIETENDLCSERKRYEIFKTMKNKEIQEIKENVSFLQKDNQGFKIKNTVLDKALEETKKKLDVYLKNNKQQKEQTETLKSLWQDLQKQNETKDQQIQSLQKLNRSLSLSLSEQKQENKNPQIPEINRSEEERNKSSNQILADLHFD